VAYENFNNNNEVFLQVATDKNKDFIFLFNYLKELFLYINGNVLGFKINNTVIYKTCREDMHVVITTNINAI
jgi:hypothetical protein